MDPDQLTPEEINNAIDDYDIDFDRTLCSVCKEPNIVCLMIGVASQGTCISMCAKCSAMFHVLLDTPQHLLMQFILLKQQIKRARKSHLS